jgi:hypothetical protein
MLANVGIAPWGAGIKPIAAHVIRLAAKHAMRSVDLGADGIADDPTALST